MIHLQNLANRLLDAFIDSTKVTKSHISAANIPAHIEIPMGKLKYSVANEPECETPDPAIEVGVERGCHAS